MYDLELTTSRRGAANTYKNRTSNLTHMHTVARSFPHPHEISEYMGTVTWRLPNQAYSKVSTIIPSYQGVKGWIISVKIISKTLSPSRCHLSSVLTLLSNDFGPGQCPLYPFVIQMQKAGWHEHVHVALGVSLHWITQTSLFPESRVWISRQNYPDWKY
jgi:hypothetical protein